MKQYVNYAYYAGLILWLVGRMMHNDLILWIGTGLMLITCIWMLIHWKENEQMQNIVSALFLIVIGLWIFFRLI